MPTHAERRVLPYTPEQMFRLVADVQHYPDFLPWCVGARIRQRSQTLIVADLMIGFRMVRERFTSRVTLDAPHRIEASYLEGPFRYLHSRWLFEPHPDGCVIDFHVDFEFKSRLLQGLIATLFGEAVHRMVAAFETRAAYLYGPPNGRASATASAAAAARPA